MEVNLDKMICKVSSSDDLASLKYYKQFIVDENIQFNCRNLRICKIKVTLPEIKIVSAKTIKTPKGTSLEGQYLSGKKLIVVGTLDFSLVIDSYPSNRKTYMVNKEIVEKVKIPFSTFIVIPNDKNCENKINLRYLIEDVSAVVLCYDKVFVTTSIFLQYMDEY